MPFGRTVMPETSVYVTEMSFSGNQPPKKKCYRRVSKCRFSKCRFGAELEKLEKIFEMEGSVEKQKPKSLGPAFPLCRRVGIDAALVKVQFSFCWVHPPIEHKIEETIQTLRWHLG